MRAAVISITPVVEKIMEEVGLRAARHFRENGGERFSRVPCLNDRSESIRMIADIVDGHSIPCARCKPVQALLTALRHTVTQRVRPVEPGG